MEIILCMDSQRKIYQILLLTMISLAVGYIGITKMDEQQMHQYSTVHFHNSPDSSIRTEKKFLSETR
jgi:hypothetical protein